jgi:hypothetical protein
LLRLGLVDFCIINDTYQVIMVHNVKLTDDWEL